MHNWNEAIGIAIGVSPMVVVVAALALTSPIAIIIIAGALLGIIFLIIIIAALIKLFWYIEDKLVGD